MHGKQSRVTRRQLLKAMGAASGAVLLAGCAPAVAPASAPAAGADASESTGMVNEDIGPYIAHTGAQGIVTFPNAWGGERIPLMEQQIADFNSFYPNVTIESSVFKTDDLEKTHLTSIAAGTPDNAIMLRADSIAFFVEQGALMPLDDLIARDEMDVDDIFYQAEIDARDAGTVKPMGCPMCWAALAISIGGTRGCLRKQALTRTRRQLRGMI